LVYHFWLLRYTPSEAWNGVNWAHLMAAQGALWTYFYDRSTRTIVGTMLWTEYRPVIKLGPKGALGTQSSHEIRPIHSAPSLGQSIDTSTYILFMNYFSQLLRGKKIKPHKKLTNGLLHWYE